MLGDAPIDQVTQGVIIQLRDKIAEKSPRNAIKAVKVLKLIFECARDHDLIDRNHAKRISPPANYIVEPYRPWSVEEIGKFKKAGRDIWRRAMMVLPYTGQRRGDVIKMCQDQISDGMIEVITSKTGSKVYRPFHTELANDINSFASYLIVGHGGKPMTPDYLSHGLQKECRRIGIEPNPPLHGLRKNAVMALIEAGCKRREVQAIAGQSMEMIEHYAREYDRRGHARAVFLSGKRQAQRTRTGHELSNPPGKVSNLHW
ncbi:MAG: tyrosine-type recombinase/integrase [Pseudomonadota bacterium]